MFKCAINADAVDLLRYELAAYRQRPNTYLKAITRFQDGSVEYVFTCKTGQDRFIAFMNELALYWVKVA